VTAPWPLSGMQLLDLQPWELDELDVQVTADDHGQPGMGLLIVVVDPAWDEQVSEPLNRRFAEALERSLNQRHPSYRCAQHGDFGHPDAQRSTAACDCAWMFVSRLLAAIHLVENNELARLQNQVLMFGVRR
jgi:hypothetical protein